LSVEEGNITLFASDLETSIRTTAPGVIEENGSAAVAGKILSNIVKALPETSVTLETVGEVLHITAGQSNFEIRTIPIADFTRFPEVSRDQQVQLPASVLRSMVTKVAKSVSRDETRATLTGIFFTIEGPSLKMVATNSYRLALVEQISEVAFDSDFEALIPGKAFEEVIRMLEGDEAVTITLAQNHILFEFGTTAFITRRLEGKYPNYKQLIPTDFATKATIDAAELLESARRVSLLALNNAAIQLTLSAADQNLELSAQSQDLGHAEESLMVKIEGEDNTIAINYSFLLDGLSVVDSSFVTLEVQGPAKPGIIRAPEENYTYLVMPIHVN
jgi:DNA polymerase-3 subunit beta